jgi:hypothetical protein
MSYSIPYNKICCTLMLCKCLACHTDEDDASQLDLQEHDEETSTEAKGDKVRNDLQQETI